MEYYINQHNKIARQYGISYKFSLPFISEDDWARTINDISLFSVFQGYPYVSTNPKLGFLNIYAIGGARIVKPDAYYITEENGKKLYHLSLCKKVINAAPEVKSQVYGSRQECALQGAYPCPDCRP